VCFDPSVLATTLVDGENVRRSAWPNVGREELVVRCRVRARREGVALLVVFDGDAPIEGPDVEGTGEASVDDRIVVPGRRTGPGGSSPPITSCAIESAGARNV